MQPAPFLGRVANVKNPIVRGAMSGQGRKPPRKLIADANHLAPNFFHPFHVGLVLLKQRDHPVDLLQFGLKLRDLAVQRLVLIRVSEVIIELFYRCIFERIQINEFQCHALKVRAEHCQVNEGFRSACGRGKTTKS